MKTSCAGFRVKVSETKMKQKSYQKRQAHPYEPHGEGKEEEDRVTSFSDSAKVSEDILRPDEDSDNLMNVS